MSLNRLYCIRGAVCAQNTKDDIIDSVGSMCGTLFNKNNIQEKDIVSIQFTITPDLDELNPATALRHCDVGIKVNKVPLFCSQEPVVKNMLKKVIRVMVTVYLPENTLVEHIYLKGAEVLRPDLQQNGDK